MTPIAQLLKKVQTLNTEKKYQEVIDTLTPQLLEKHHNADLYAEQAMAFYRLQEIEPCRVAAEKALAINQRQPKANNYMGNVYGDQKNYEMAIEYFLKSIEADPKYSYPYHGLGIVYYDQKNYEKAIEYYEKAIEADPKDAYPYNNLGNVYYYQKNYEKAIEYYLKSIETDPKFAYPYNGLGFVYKEQKNYEKAIEYYLKSIEADPKFALPYNSLGIVNYNQKNYEKAIEYYEKAIEADPKDAYPYYNLGIVYADQKNNEKAIEYYLKSIEADPNQDAAYYNRAISYFELQQYEDALVDYKKKIELTKQAPDYYTERAITRVAEIEKLLSSKDLESIGELVNSIKKLLLFTHNQVTHYTGLGAAKELVMNNSPLRLSEATYLNDTSEGRELFKFLYPNAERAAGKPNTPPFSKKPFIGSFVSPEKHDDLTLWRMYAKEDREEARGCALTINKESLLQAIKQKLAPDGQTGSLSGMEDDFSFYRVAYREEGNNREFMIPGATEKDDELNVLMKKLKDAVIKFEKNKKKTNDDKLFVREKLNTIAYLFKTAQYQYEHEIRLVVKEAIGFHILFLKEAVPPRVYIELVPIAPHLEKITIGPKVARADEWHTAFYYKLKGEKLEPGIIISVLPYK
jgi:tetratricopeptide (TPR) repeat protein